MAMIVAIVGWQQRDLVLDALDPASGYTLVTTTEVNLRSGAGVEFPVITVLPAELEVTRSGDSEHGFTPVVANGDRGWISSEWLRAPAPAGVVYASSYPAAPREQSPLAPTSAPLEQTLVAENNQTSDVAQPGERWIEVNRTTRTVTLHDGDTVVAELDALIGKDPSPDGIYSTAVGTFHVWMMEPGLAEASFLQDIYFTHVVGFDPDRRNGFQSPTRDAQGNVLHTGSQQTLGSVQLSEQDAITLFEFAHIGMRVEVHD